MKAIEDILSKDYISFLKKKKINVEIKNEFDEKECFFRIKKFYNLTDSNDILQLNNEYEGRFASGYFIIADVDNGDYLLMDNNKGSIYFWNHEINDLAYDSSAEPPSLISESIKSFLKSLKESSEIDLEPDVESIKVSDDFNKIFKDYLK